MGAPRDGQHGTRILIDGAHVRSRKYRETFTPVARKSGAIVQIAPACHLGAGDREEAWNRMTNSVATEREHANRPSRDKRSTERGRRRQKKTRKNGKAACRRRKTCRIVIASRAGAHRLEFDGDSVGGGTGAFRGARFPSGECLGGFLGAVPVSSVFAVLVFPVVLVTRCLFVVRRAPLGLVAAFACAGESEV